jgi:sarcosine oxidase subunit beta
VIGASVAHHLLERAPRLRVVLLEQEATLGTGATGKATGGVRHQFSTEANIRLTLLSYPYFIRAHEVLGCSVDFVRHGYLLVTTSPLTLAGSARAVALQRSLGVQSEMVGGPELRRLLPALAADDLVGGSFCEDDGSADPHGLLQAFVSLARQRGLDVRTEAPVTAISTSAGRLTGVRTPRGEIAAPVVVNCAGPYADSVGRLAGIDVPSRPHRCQVLVCERVNGLPDVFPLTVDLDSGWYVHGQTSAVLMGGTDKDRRPGHDSTVDWSALSPVFDGAARRVPLLADARVVRAYAGLRDVTPDHHGILGQAPGLTGFYFACGFSGHGFMHSPAIGRLTTELILDGRVTSMDVTALEPGRFTSGDARVGSNVF